MGIRITRHHYAWIIAATGLLVVMSTLGLARFSYAMILPSMKDGLGLSYTQTGLLATANFVGYSLFTLISGFLAIRYSPRKLISLSLLLISITMVLTGLSQTVEEAILFRFLTGIGSGGSNTPVMGLASVWFGANLRGMALGIMTAGNGIALILTGFLVPEILEIFGDQGWRYSWHAMSAVIITVVIISYLLLRDEPKEKGLEPLRRSSYIPDKAGTSDRSGRSLTNPLKSHILYHLGLVFIVFGFTHPIYATFFTVYLVREIGLSVELAGWLWSTVGAVSTVSGFIWGTVSDKIGRGKSIALVYLSLASSFLLFIGLRNVAGFFLSSILFGLSAFATPTIMAAAAGDYFGSRRATFSLAILNSIFFGAGQMTGPWVAGYIADTIGSFTPAYGISVFVLIAGSALAYLLKTPGEKTPKNHSVCIE
ncbi:MAG: MFS transporter [Nitrososphaeria archaeon]|nr:MFS transporter [Nitrososphaeria archaeon]NIQ34202.1 MFS transporter [Nitrososphaeria archaeon]